MGGLILDLNDLVWVDLQLVSPGAWLSDLCQERYEVREKKTSKKVLLFSFFLFFLCILSFEVILPLKK